MRRAGVPILIAVWVLFALSACSDAPKVRSPKQYEKDGVAFSMPGNWKVTGDKAERGATNFRYITLEGPGDLLLCVTHYQARIEVSLEEYARVITEEQGKNEMANLINMKSGSSTATRATIMSQERAGIRQDVECSLMGQTVPFYREYYKVSGNGWTAFLMVQAPADKWETVRPGFQVVYDSLGFASP